MLPSGEQQCPTGRCAQGTVWLHPWKVGTVLWVDFRDPALPAGPGPRASGGGAFLSDGMRLDISDVQHARLGLSPVSGLCAYRLLQARAHRRPCERPSLPSARPLWHIQALVPTPRLQPPWPTRTVLRHGHMRHRDPLLAAVCPPSTPYSLTLTRPPSLARSQPRARAARRQARGCAHAQPKLAFLRDPRQRERGGRRLVPPHTSGHRLPRCGPATASAAAVAAATAAAATPTVATAASPAQPAALATPSIAFAVTCEPASTAALPMASCSTLAAMACLLLCGSGRRAGTVLRSAAHPLCWRRPAWRHCARGLYPADPHGLWRAVGCGPHSDGSYEPRRWVDAPAPCCPPWRR